MTSEDLDVVVNAFGTPIGEEEAHVKAGRALITALKNIDTRVIVVVGAGSLYVDEAQTTKLIDTSEFLEIFISTAKGQGGNLQGLRDHKE